MAHHAAAAAEIVLVGTVHGDPQGYDRARELLRALAPDTLTVEISRFSLRYRQRHQGQWRQYLARALAALTPRERRHQGVRRIAAQIEMPFEVRAAADHAREAGIAWHPVDVGATAREHLPRYRRELLTPENLRAVAADADGDLGELVAQEYLRAARLLADPRGGGQPRRPRLREPEAVRRERVLAARLARLALAGGRLVHLGGWEHLIGGPGLPTLAALLAPAAVRRLLLRSGEPAGGGDPVPPLMTG